MPPLGSAERRAECVAFGKHLRTVRHAQGLTQTQVSANINRHINTYRGWELGNTRPSIAIIPVLAAALGVPIARLFEHESPCIAEVRVSTASLERCRKEGREAAGELAGRIASQLEPLIWQEATRKPVDSRKGARAKPRRSRFEILTAMSQSRRSTPRNQ